jgi:hypothetical protein
MGCCIALALLISLARRAWFTVLPGSEPEQLLFAPPARRAGPGEAPVAVAEVAVRKPRRSLRAVVGVAMVAAGCAWCGLNVLGVLVPAFGSSAVCPCACCSAASGSALLLHAPGLLATAAGGLLLVAARLRPVHVDA